ncbi:MULTISPECIES: urease accessory protein UreD [Nocardiaceae]|jgi:urease accessory protein|uniref:urease accessory protein UreD n=1 Tax=Nocardiaceae TaxID=85025 RepID=UPI0005664166|nr:MULTISPECIES: urease accessory protein UreD [Rhodococcus]OZE95227.1 urease accessory protein [Rhodococcus sp. 15-1189-1-1a]OZF09925.1 urease accessory protein [Rhodococcus sp. 14-2686-1-2]OZF44388.1 urease accessory protein [Rhodococcus sp. 14-2470-1b]
MRTELLIVASAERSPRIISSGGLSGRLTGPDTVHMIGTAATPLGGDEMRIRVEVGKGASLTVHSVAATLALPSATTPESHSWWSFHVDDGGTLLFDPEPMIVAADARHHSRTDVRFSDSGSIHIRERIQIGRAGERAGSWCGTVVSDVDCGGGRIRPHLRHRVELGAGTSGHDVISAPMAMSSTIRFPDDRSPEAGRSWVRMPLAAGGTLSTATGSRIDTLALPT